MGTGIRLARTLLLSAPPNKYPDTRDRRVCLMCALEEHEETTCALDTIATRQEIRPSTLLCISLDRYGIVRTGTSHTE